MQPQQPVLDEVQREGVVERPGTPLERRPERMRVRREHEARDVLGIDHIGAMMLPSTTAPLRLLGMKGMSSPVVHITELVADLRLDPVP